MPFQVVSVNNAGTFGVVVQVIDKANPRHSIGLKLLEQTFLKDDRVLRRTRDEARLLSKLKHPNILQVFGFADYDGCPVIEMEWVHGITLQQVIQRWSDGLPPAIAFDITRTICAALEFAYTHPADDTGSPMRVMHRDLKPTNIMVSETGVVKIIDFGLAYGDFHNRESITNSMVLGTRRYLSPERLDGQKDTPKGDMYAIGIMLLEMLIGKALQLSLNPSQHQKRLRMALDYLPKTELPHIARKRLTKLIASMVAYEPEHRATYRGVIKELGAIMAVSQLTPNLNHFARAYVAPCIQQPSVPARKHPMYDQVKFLEGMEPKFDRFHNS